MVNCGLAKSQKKVTTTSNKFVKTTSIKGCLSLPIMGSSVCTCQMQLNLSFIGAAFQTDFGFCATCFHLLLIALNAHISNFCRSGGWLVRITAGRQGIDFAPSALMINLPPLMINWSRIMHFIRLADTDKLFL